MTPEETSHSERE